MIVVFNGMQLIGLIIFILFVIIYGTIYLIRELRAWSKTGFCKHSFKLDRTNSFGQKHWYKCEKCKEERLR